MTSTPYKIVAAIIIMFFMVMVIEKINVAPGSFKKPPAPTTAVEFCIEGKVHLVIMNVRQNVALTIQPVIDAQGNTETCNR